MISASSSLVVSEYIIQGTDLIFNFFAAFIRWFPAITTNFPFRWTRAKGLCTQKPFILIESTSRKNSSFDIVLGLSFNRQISETFRYIISLLFIY
jgi:hypothetical protein